MLCIVIGMVVSEPILNLTWSLLNSSCLTGDPVENVQIVPPSTSNRVRRGDATNDLALMDIKYQLCQNSSTM
jgi:hypothetical protein